MYVCTQFMEKYIKEIQNCNVKYLKSSLKKQTAKWSSSTKISWSCSFRLWFICLKINNYSYLKAFLIPALPSMTDQGQQKQFNIMLWISQWVKEDKLHQLRSARHISVTLLQPEWPCVAGLGRQLEAEISWITPCNEMHQDQSVDGVAESRRIFLSHGGPRWFH